MAATETSVRSFPIIIDGIDKNRREELRNQVFLTSELSKMKYASDGFRYRWLRKGGLLIICASERFAWVIEKSERFIPEFFGADSTVKKPKRAFEGPKEQKFELIVKGVDVSVPDEMLITMNTRGGFTITRFRRKDGEMMRMVKLSCIGREAYDFYLTNGVFVGFESIRCEPFVEKKRKRFCFRCFRSGHIAKDCKNERKCGTCAAALNDDEKHNCRDKIKCVRCGESHPTWKCKSLIIDPFGKKAGKAAVESNSDLSSEEGVLKVLKNYRKKFENKDDFKLNLAKLVEEASNMNSKSRKQKTKASSIQVSRSMDANLASKSSK